MSSVLCWIPSICAHIVTDTQYCQEPTESQSHAKAQDGENGHTSLHRKARTPSKVSDHAHDAPNGHDGVRPKDLHATSHKQAVHAKAPKRVARTDASAKLYAQAVPHGAEQHAADRPAPDAPLHPPVDRAAATPSHGGDAPDVAAHAPKRRRKTHHDTMS